MVDPDGFLQRCRYILTSPEKEWYSIVEEDKPPSQLTLHFALPLILFGSLALWAGGFFQVHMLWDALLNGLQELVLLLIFSAGVWFLTQRISSYSAFSKAFRISVYSLGVLWICQIPANLTFLLSWVEIFGLYGLYVLYLGIVPALNARSNMQNPLFIAFLFWFLVSYIGVEVLFM